MAQQKSWLSRMNIFARMGERDRVETLLITGNYGRSRVLAELAQEKRKHPILLISPEAGGRNDIYFMPTRPEALALPEDQFLEYVEFLKPKRVVVLGDETYVPTRFLDQLRGSNVQTIVLNSKDWNKNAEALATIIQYLAAPAAPPAAASPTPAMMAPLMVD
jgi:hypothetical protein